jgi:hypothetical protein
LVFVFVTESSLDGVPSSSTSKALTQHQARETDVDDDGDVDGDGDGEIDGGDEQGHRGVVMNSEDAEAEEDAHAEAEKRILEALAAKLERAFVYPDVFSSSFPLHLVLISVHVIQYSGIITTHLMITTPLMLFLLLIWPNCRLQFAVVFSIPFKTCSSRSFWLLLHQQCLHLQLLISNQFKILQRCLQLHLGRLILTNPHYL